MQTITLTAPDISCDHCKQTIERELSTVAGVQAVSVDVPSTQVRVTFDPQQVSETQIVARLDDEGYPVVR
jgi:copper chaperone